MNFQNKTILVTGGAGSIGSGIIRNLLHSGAEKIISFDTNEIDNFLLEQHFSDKRFVSVTGDVRSLESLEELFSAHKFDIIFHAAAMKHVVACEHTPNEAVRTNIGGTQNVVNMALKYGVEKFILISTDKAAQPTNVMGATKYVAERITLKANERGNGIFACVRFGNVANTRGSVIPVFVKNLGEGKPLKVTDRSVTRFMIKMDEAVNLIFKATKNATGGEIFILEMKAFKLGDLVDVIKNRIAPKLGVKPSEVKIIESGLVSGEKLHEDLINDKETEHLYRLDGMYVATQTPRTWTKANLVDYNSSDAEMIDHDTLEEIAMEYLESSLHYSKLVGKNE